MSCCVIVKKYVFKNYQAVINRNESGKELGEEQILKQFLQYKKLYKLEYDKTCNYEFHPLTAQYSLKFFDR